MTGKFNPQTKFGSDDHRSRSPIFQGEEFIRSLEIVEKLKSIAAARNVSLSQLALRWVLDSFNSCGALVGAKTKDQLAENLGSDGWHLDDREMSLIKKVLEI